MKKTQDFTQGAIVLPLIRFALPVLAALFLQTMYGAVDLLVVGQYASAADVSAVSTGSQLMHTMTVLISAFFFTGSDPSVLDLLSDSMESRKKALTERSLTRRGRFSWEAEKYKIRKRGFHGKDFMI